MMRCKFISKVIEDTAMSRHSVSVCLLGKDEERERSMKSHTLPLELIREILLRLPVRSLLRLKIVCKTWRALISDPQFGISHYDLAAAPSHRLLLRSNPFFVESFDIENSSAVNLPLPLPSPPRNWGNYNSNAHFDSEHEILGSYRGLILLHNQARYENHLILWNPSTGVHKRLSDLRFGSTPYFLYGFGYDPSTDDYLLVLIGYLDEYDGEPNDEPNIQIFSFKTNSWKEDRVNVPYEIFDDKFRSGSLLNETLHWLVICENQNVPVIIAFDLIQRTGTERWSFSEIPLPDHLTVEEYEEYNLRVLGGCLSVCCSVQDCDTTEIWVMKEYKVQSSWTMTIDLPAYGLSLICTTKDGGMYVSNNCGLQKINHNGEPLENLAFDGDKELFCANLPSALYRESLVSLPSVIRETTQDDQL